MFNWIRRLLDKRQKPPDTFAEMSSELSLEAFRLYLVEKHDISLFKSMIEPMIGREVPVPAGAKCMKCGSEKLKRIGAPAWGRWGGNIECLNCGYKESLMAHIGKSCFSVEPL